MVPDRPIIESKPLAAAGAAAGEATLARLAAGLDAGLVGTLGGALKSGWAALATFVGLTLALAALTAGFILASAPGRVVAASAAFSAFADLPAAGAFAGAAGLVPLRLAAGDTDLLMLFFSATTTS